VFVLAADDADAEIPVPRAFRTQRLSSTAVVLVLERVARFRGWFQHQLEHASVVGEREHLFGG
jgi:hypothetical protein